MRDSLRRNLYIRRRTCKRKASAIGTKLPCDGLARRSQERTTSTSLGALNALATPSLVSAVFRAIRNVINLIPTPKVYVNENGVLPVRARINLLIKFAILTPLMIGAFAYPGCVWIGAIIALPIVVLLGYTQHRKRAARLAAGLCQNCAYDRTGLAKLMVCPECGAPVTAS